MFKKFLSLACVFAFCFSFAPISNAVTDEQMSYIGEFSEKINVPVKDFLFDVEEKGGESDSPKTTKCALVPIQDIDDHKNCVRAIFGRLGNKEYMQ